MLNFRGNMEQKLYTSLKDKKSSRIEIDKDASMALYPNFIEEREKYKTALNLKWSEILNKEVSGDAGILLNNQEKHITLIKDSGSTVFNNKNLDNIYLFVLEFCIKNPQTVGLRSTIDLSRDSKFKYTPYIYPHKQINFNSMSDEMYRKDIIDSMGEVECAVNILSATLDYPQLYSETYGWVGLKKEDI
jgi:hypothetical protein